MNLLGNIIWLLFGGLFTAVGYILASIPFFISIIGIPFGIQTVKLGIFALWPFGSKAVVTEQGGGCLYTMMNLIWILIGGIWISLSHILWGVLLAITIIGIPFAKQHFKMASLALTPFGRTIVDA
jgi:uncharacterized membrane protein YccF (DUF307 family)